MKIYDEAAQNIRILPQMQRFLYGNYNFLVFDILKR